MDFIVDRKRQKTLLSIINPKWSKALILFAVFFIFTIIIDYFLPKEGIEGIVEQTTIDTSNRSVDNYIYINGDKMMLSGIPVSSGDYIRIKRTPIYNQIMSYNIEYQLDDEYIVGDYYGHYYGVFCFIPICLIIALGSLYFSLNTNNTLRPLFTTVLFLIINLWMALA